MITQAADFLAETLSLDAVLAPLEADDYGRATRFKGWTIDDVLGHLHFWNRAAMLSLTDEPALIEVGGAVMKGLGQGRTLREMEQAGLGELSGFALRDAWLALARELAEAYEKADPALRLKWVGPDMGPRSAITARQMETWAHGQAVYDLLGLERVDSDRLRNVAELGVRTFGWTFTNRREPVPEPAPTIVLTAPSGECWTWNENPGPDRIEGSATAFCQVVTQVRNVADTDLAVTGPIAEAWMARAQCFAGPAVDPPPPGTRFRETNMTDRKGASNDD